MCYITVENIPISFILPTMEIIQEDTITQWRKKQAVACIILTWVLKRRKSRRRWDNRLIWSHSWLQRRPNLGAYSTILQELRLEDQMNFRSYLRMDEDCFCELLEKIRPFITKQDTTMRPAIPAEERFALTLRYLATGESYSSLQFSFRIGRTTIGQIVPEVCLAIYTCLKDDFMQVPRKACEWQNIADGFEKKWNFPNCIGALDGKHIAVQAPTNSGSYYFNYKGHFSIVLLALVDADYKFTYIDVGCNGRVSDGGVLRESSLQQSLDDDSLGIPQSKPLPFRDMDVPYVIVGDDAFPLKENIMKPYPNKTLNLESRIFNYRLSRARRVSENAFGILSHRFRIFKSNILVDPDTAVYVVKAAVALHNYLRLKSSDYITSSAGDGEGNDEQTKENNSTDGLLPLPNQGSNRSSQTARDIRDEFREYFVTDGEIEWQWEKV